MSQYHYHPKPPFSVLFWGSHPDADNDDCWTGQDFVSLEEARECFNAKVTEGSTAYVELEGPDGRLDLRENPDYEPSEDDDSDWRREIAMEAGMMGGCDAYNEVMGWD